ncbi:retinal pigment epithelial membrane family protein [Histoplasma capsulatum var. duboisii H88]|uniref:Retinal pigment epithelial membrane family protein n=1 Tax=Ajellomyces capsulatus (strain H88) TaxID=544711 RepID=F0UF64_AJEC8|nr:retinal pigment epithelial membrane family protein [Histoplasma capsulatum var. duboisii H88]
MDAVDTSVKSFNDWPNHQGFNSTYEERIPVELKVTGDIPAWAAGVLYRTGTGRSEIETDKKETFKIAHWFDGLSVVHRFQILPLDEIHPSVRVFYNSRSCCDGLIERIRKTGKGKDMSFGARYEPCTSYFQKVMSLFRPAPARTGADQRSMSITLSVNFPGLSSTATQKTSGHASGIHTLANKTDAAAFQTLDPETLEPIGVASQQVLHPDLKGPLSAAHAKSDPVTGDVYNFNLQLGKCPIYHVFHVSAATGKTSILATLTNARAAYIHSFFLTKHYVVLCVWNSFYVAGGLAILWHKNIIDAMADYDPSKKTTWYVIDRRPADQGGKGLVATYKSDPFFCFHTINAYEEPALDDSGSVDIVADLTAYNNLDVLKRFYLSNIISTSPDASKYAAGTNDASRGLYKRFRLPSLPVPSASSSTSTSSSRKRTKPRRATLDFKADALDTPELPTLNPNYVTRRHRYVYGVTSSGKSSFVDGLVKFDTETRQSIHWNEWGQNAGEAIFVPRRRMPTNESPRGSGADGDGEAIEEVEKEGESEPFDEDDGVLLSVVLDGLKGRSYLLVLNAKNMTEVGRAEVAGPIGFGFHGTHVSALRGGKGLDF